MSLSPSDMIRLIDAGLTTDQLRLVAEVMAAKPARSGSAERMARKRARDASQSVTVTDECDEPKGSFPSSDGFSPDLSSLTTTLSPKTPEKAREAVAKPETKRATRFPAEQNLPPTWTEYAAGKGLSLVETETEFEKFRNYWIAKSGKDATKTDWAATWRNWIITAVERRGPRNQAGSAHTGGGNKPSRGWSANLSQHRPDPEASPFAGPTVIEGEYTPKRSGGGVR